MDTEQHTENEDPRERATNRDVAARRRQLRLVGTILASLDRGHAAAALLEARAMHHARRGGSLREIQEEASAISEEVREAVARWRARLRPADIEGFVLDADRSAARLLDRLAELEQRAPRPPL